MLVLPLLVAGCVNDDLDTQIKINCALLRNSEGEDLEKYDSKIRRLIGLEKQGSIQTYNFCGRYYSY